MILNPCLYEINTRTFIQRLSEKYNRTVTLGSVPDSEWEDLARRGFDLVWLMGVWRRSPRARREALSIPSLRQEYSNILPGWTEQDVAGSPYAIYEYDLDPALGKPEELGQLKSRLGRFGLGLILDFVPNHLAVDHPWVQAHPEWFVRGTEADAGAHPDWFFSPENGVYLAHGKDPYFPPWSDTVQVNFYAAGLRRALINELLSISEIADGVRCDMAMLGLNEIFGQIWGKTVKEPQPQAEFWAEAIPRVKKWRPDFVFIAEVYWGLERKLQELGFDFTYDKGLYDRLRHGGAPEIRDHLKNDTGFHRRCVHFIENHDEPRAVTAFGRDRSKAAAVAVMTLPGVRMFHDGQLEGRHIRVPVQLAREPRETTDNELLSFYEALLEKCQDAVYHDGDWQLLEAGEAAAGDDSYHNLLAWYWSTGSDFRLVVINYSDGRSQGYLTLPFPLPGILYEELTGKVRTLPPAAQHGLYLELDPYEGQVWSPKNAEGGAN